MNEGRTLCICGEGLLPLRYARSQRLRDREELDFLKLQDLHHT